MQNELVIDDPESERLILELSTLTGETVESVLLTALSERLEQEKLNKLRKDTGDSTTKEFGSSTTFGDQLSRE